MSVRELHNILVSDPTDGGLKDARDDDGKIITIDSTLRSLLPQQLKKCPHVTRLCVVANVVFLLKACRDSYLKKLKDESQNAQSRRSGEKEHHIYETYKNKVMPHRRHIYAKTSDIENATMCAYPHSDHELPHWKCVLK